MPQTLRYGINSTFEIDLPSDVLLADCSSHVARALDDPAAAVAAALADPLDFPPLSRATVSGDRVAIALEPGLPQAPALVAGVVHSILETGGDPADVTIVQTLSDFAHASRDVTSLLPPRVRESVKVVTHDPVDAGSLAYLAASKSGEPVYVNRALCDADVVLPIETFRLDPASSQSQLHAGWFPAFCNEETARRFRDLHRDNRQKRRIRQHDELEEAVWLLGIQFTVQVIPGRGDSVLHILAGDVNSVASRGRMLCESAWRFEVPRRASLVVATIEGGEEQQTWENFARALTVASKAVIDHGAIVLCTELKRQPGPALRRLVSLRGHDPQAAGDAGDRSLEDAVPATVLAETCRSARVYLLSGLASDMVEEMGLGYVAETAEIARLSRQHDSCILVPSAQHAVVVAQND